MGGGPRIPIVSVDLQVAVHGPDDICGYAPTVPAPSLAGCRVRIWVLRVPSVRSRSCSPMTTR